MTLVLTGKGTVLGGGALQKWRSKRGSRENIGSGPPLPVTVTTRNIRFLIGNPNLSLYLPLLLGGGGRPKVYKKICLYFHIAFHGIFDAHQICHPQTAKPSPPQSVYIPETRTPESLTASNRLPLEN